MATRYLSFALFDRKGGLLAESIKGADPHHLMEAIRVVLKNEDGRARGTVATVLGKLSYQEIAPLLPTIHQAIVKQTPSRVSFSMAYG